MRWILLLLTLPGTSDLGTIDQLNECVQLRFETLAPGPGGRLALGMSRVMRPPSMGEHFLPKFVSQRDFEPETDREKEVLAKLEQESVQVGFYLFGRAILDSVPSDLNPRSLKGPGAITKGTPRAAWYPAGFVPAAQSDALPDWQTIYPLAQKAMRSFAAGDAAFETATGSWHIAARPVMAAQSKCQQCHANVASGEPIGGVFYAYRRAPK
jgi:hypothetical protein